MNNDNINDRYSLPYTRNVNWFNELLKRIKTLQHLEKLQQKRKQPTIFDIVSKKEDCNDP